MKKEEIIAELVRVAEKMKIKIIEDKLLSKGGYCRVFTQKYLIMDKKLEDNDKIELLVNALRRTDLEEIYMAPRVREIFSDDE